ncbi:MAG: hypothetical protein WDZ35_02210 [Crocinitomicaceae bacterium]
MEMIKNLLIDSLNGFSPDYILFFLFQLLVAGFLGHLFQIILNRKFKSEVLRNAALIAVGVALITSVSKYVLPFAVLAAAAIIVLAMNRKDKSEIGSIALFLVVSVGVGCGVGSVIQTFIGAILLFLILLFLPMKDNVEEK